ncbi:translation initiation factor IF-2, mitochondrial isoform X1 [Diorhabda sublineata]|uniref:translation initiation factor IF-2, mitochondrial isoform X1 n=1 Tax=Diorhabda sublineata TaxID=1163346 RepID=UPI0024E1943D|nr:translation initiation factor IF-2, mitochondrial isoform X1 [Diorhabda sublineata]
MAFYTSCLCQSVLLASLNKYQTVNVVYRRISSVIYRKSKEKVQYVQYLYPINIHTGLINYKRRKTAEERKSARIIEYSPKSKGDIVGVWRNITLEELAKVLNKDIHYVYDIFLNQFRNPQTSISDIKLLQQGIRRSGRRMRIIAKPTEDIEKIVKHDVYPRPPPSKSELKPRPPVVTIMGHVDHGKTTLLDALRNSKVVDQEFGGITQHIGAFSVVLNSGTWITFLDTPGHAAFTAMRSRGANVTDIVVLVVAADDGVMEQTLESIRMAKQARVPILVAINKIDSPKADISRTEKMLVASGIQVENLGGDVQAIPISALKKQNLEQLTEALAVQAELLEIGADPTGPVEAVVIESKLDQFRGKLCTVIVQRGTLRKGDILVAGTSIAKVRALKDDKGKLLDQVTPGYPAEIEGWRELPQAGEQVLQVESERKARDVQRFRETEKELEKMKDDLKVILEKEEQHNKEYKEKLELKRKLGRYKLKPEGPRKPQWQDDEFPSLNVILRADVDGTLEAILNTLDTYDSDNCKMDLVHYGVGSITETDIELAETFKGVIYAFNVDLPLNLKARASKVPIKHHNVIYKLIEDIKEELNSRLPLKEQEEILGEATVLQVFQINQGRKTVPVAGCQCLTGLLKRSAEYKVIRKGEIIHTGSLSSMRHLKNEVDVIKSNTECGLQFLDKTITFEKGDVIICFEKKLVPQKTDWDPGF